MIAAVFLLSFSSLAWEVLLARVFAFSQWNHLSFMVISIVMFGYAASGTGLSLMEARRPGLAASAARAPALPGIILLFSLSACLAYLLVLRIPLDYFRLPVEGRQALYLAAAYLALAVPFLLAGAVVSLGFAGRPERSGAVYLATMCGSGLGAAAPALLLPVLGEGRLLAAAALLPAAALVVPLLLARGGSGSAQAGGRGRRGWGLLATLLAGVAVTIGGGALLASYRGGALLAPAPSPYKLLAQAVQFPDTRIVATRVSLRGRFDELATDHLRFAPGLSLRFQGRLPPRRVLLRDGDQLFLGYSGPPEELAFALASHAAAAYHLLPGAPALILQQDGGVAPAAARASGAAAVRLVVEYPWVARRLGEAWSQGGGELPLQVEAGNPRAVLAASGSRYGIIQVEHWGASIPGTASLEQEHLLTVEALAACLQRLTPDGILSLSRRLLLPPSDSLRLFAAAWEALHRRGVQRPERHLAMIRGFDTYTLLASPAPFQGARLEALLRFAREGNFDPLYYPGMGEGEANRFNRFAEPFHYREIQRLQEALASGELRRYYASYPLAVRPATDDRPFHNRSVRWLRAAALYRSAGRRLYALLLSGEVVVAVVLVVALLVSAVLLLLPRLLARPGSVRSTPRAGAPGGRRLAAPLFFLSCGAGFMLAEMAFIQRYTLLLGDPVAAFTMVLAVLLVCSGMGGYLSRRLGPRGLAACLALLLLCLGLLLAAGPLLPGWLLGMPAATRAVLAAVLLGPPGLLLGVPFPVGLRTLAVGPAGRAYAWGANGVASTLGAILALPVAMSWGISAVLGIAGAWYGAALALAAGRAGRRVLKAGAEGG